MLAKYGFVASDEGMDGDHITEIQFGGKDVLENLWPLDAGVNRGAGPTLAGATVTYPATGKSIKISDLKANARAYYFKIKNTL